MRHQLPHEQHLARLKQADLFLDSLPYNAHTTASDALWAGLPLLTCLGTSFPGRVAASLLTAIGMPELVTRSMIDYEQLAIHLAGDAQAMEALRQKLAANRLTTPLFDTDLFRRNLESAYTAMWQAWENGEPARGFCSELRYGTASRVSEKPLRRRAILRIAPNLPPGRFHHARVAAGIEKRRQRAIARTVFRARPLRAAGSRASFSARLS